jgi:hypothetical protein
MSHLDKRDSSSKEKAKVKTFFKIYFLERTTTWAHLGVQFIFIFIFIFSFFKIVNINNKKHVWVNIKRKKKKMR